MSLSFVVWYAMRSIVFRFCNRLFVCQLCVVCLCVVCLCLCLYQHLTLLLSIQAILMCAFKLVQRKAIYLLCKLVFCSKFIHAGQFLYTVFIFMSNDKKPRFVCILCVWIFIEFMLITVVVDVDFFVVEHWFLSNQLRISACKCN